MGNESPDLLLWCCTFLAAFAAVSNAGQVAVYWGQNSGEGSLVETCASGLYNFVNIVFLNKFSNGQDPDLNLADHYEHASGTCSALSSEISSCKDSGVKVLLSLGGAASSYSLASAATRSSPKSQPPQAAKREAKPGQVPRQEGRWLHPGHHTAEPI